MTSMNYRQIHLDFHTSEKIEGIGKDFSKKQFQDNLQRGHINSITVFSKCHHGWAYHPSQANTMHPHLSFDLLGEQIAAAHEIGVKTPVYISAGLDQKLARKHPEWLYRCKNESTTWIRDFTQPGYHLFCFNNPYLDILIAQIEEVVSRYDADGIFLDIVKPKPCYCQNCVNALLEQDQDPYDEKNAIAYGEQLYARYTQRVREAVDKFKPGLPVFHNGGHIAKGRSDLAHMNTHLELESLPTGGWGYDHFPLSAKYCNHGDQEFLGMTGKFHTTWGEFGGFKHPNALIYETSLSIAMGAKCSIGDQLHPHGPMDPLTYDIIGQAYQAVEAKEAWCNQVQNVAQIGILSAESVATDPSFEHTDSYPMDVGANRMMLQSHYLYDIIDADCEFSKYSVLILPDRIRLDDNLQTLLKDFVDNGGKLLVTGESGLMLDKDEFGLDLGIHYQRRCDITPNYYRPHDKLGPFLPSSMVMYSECEEVTTTGGTVLGDMELSFFNREVFHFCSHQHAPSTMTQHGSGMIESASAIYIPWKLFSEFADVGALHLREMVSYALDRLLGQEKKITTNLPSSGIVTLMHQPKEQRHVLHLLYAAPVVRGSKEFWIPSIEVIEDLVPIHNTNIQLQWDQPVQRVYLAPEMNDVEYEYSGGVLHLTVDEFTCHQMIVIE